jgi:CRISPR-associated protein Cmr3
MWIRLQPLDTVFFRDGKPFSQGEETWGDSTVFPPPPSVFYGALRSLYFSQHPDEFAKLHQGFDRTTALRLTAVYLENRNEQVFYVPTPRDIVMYNKGKKFAFLQLAECMQTSNDRTHYLLVPPQDQVGKAEEPYKFLKTSAYQSYLQGQLDSTGFASIPCIPEPKVGIGRDDVTHVAGEEGRLYRVDMLRLATRDEKKKQLNTLRQWKFLLEFNGLDLTGKGILKLGGEHKAAQYEIFSDLPDIALPPPVEPFEYFKLCLTTPAIFKSGWCPDLNNLGIKLLVAAVGKPCYIGGFDMKKRKPKNMYRAVPTGSVYYFKCSIQDNQRLIDQLHGKAISDIYPEQGFGIAYMGKCLEFPST